MMTSPKRHLALNIKERNSIELSDISSPIVTHVLHNIINTAKTLRHPMEIFRRNNSSYLLNSNHSRTDNGLQNSTPSHLRQTM